MSFTSTRFRPTRFLQAWSTVSSRAPIARTSFLYSTRPSHATSIPFAHCQQRLFHPSLSRSETLDDVPATKFAQLGADSVVDDVIIDTITRDMNLDTMTPVQSQTIHEALKGVDVLAQAKTGTGKTLGFLLPVVQNILASDPSLRSKSFGRRSYARTGRDTDTGALIISPTRELAEQIADVARKLTRNTAIKVQTAVGGTQRSQHMRQMLIEGCNILVGTPGRLDDILGDDAGGIKVRQLNTLVLDEADRLLDDGFRTAIEDIMAKLPDPQERDRQTLMFSATIGRSVERLARDVMKPDLHYVQTVLENEAPTHERVKQYLVELEGTENQFPALLELINKESEAASKDATKRPFKAMIFMNTTAEVQYYADVITYIKRQRTASPIIPREVASYFIHSKLTQAQRTRAADLFRKCTSGILISSDVTARGMDFPNVTHVIQLGPPSEPESYIHRLGRTARAGAEGEGWIMVARNGGLDNLDQAIGRMPLVPNRSLECASYDYLSHDDMALDAPTRTPGDSYSLPLAYNAIIREAVNDIRRATGGRISSVLRSAGGALIQHEDPRTMVQAFVEQARVNMKETLDLGEFSLFIRMGSGGRRRSGSRGSGSRGSGSGSGSGTRGERSTYGGRGSAYGGGSIPPSDAYSMRSFGGSRDTRGRSGRNDFQGAGHHRNADSGRSPWSGRGRR